MLIEADDVERVLADIDAGDGDCSIEFLRHSVLLVFGAPCQRNLLAGQEHGRTIPLAEAQRAPSGMVTSASPRLGRSPAAPSRRSTQCAVGCRRGWQASAFAPSDGTSLPF